MKTGVILCSLPVLWKLSQSPRSIKVNLDPAPPSAPVLLVGPHTASQAPAPAHSPAHPWPCTPLCSALHPTFTVLPTTFLVPPGPPLPLWGCRHTWVPSQLLGCRGMGPRAPGHWVLLAPACFPCSLTRLGQTGPPKGDRRWDGDRVRAWGQPLLRGVRGPRARAPRPPRPALSAHPVSHVARDTGCVGTQAGLWPGDTGAAGPVHPDCMPPTGCHPWAHVTTVPAVRWCATAQPRPASSR